MAKLYFYYSSMNAGKSTSLLQSSYNYRERGMRTLVFAPSFDDRYGAGKIVRLCRERGWLLIAPRSGLGGSAPVAAIARLEIVLRW